jgi:PAS domain S-box-containing protein
MIEKSNRQYIEEIKSLRRQMAYSEQLKAQYQETIAKLTENEKLYRDLAENDPDWTFWLNADDRLIYISSSCRRLTGYEPEDFKKDAKLLFKIIHPDDRTAFDDHIRFMHKAKSHVEEEFRIVRKDRKTRWISHICQPVYAADGQYAGILCSDRDITESKDTGNVSQEGEKLYRLVAENMSDVIWMMDVSLQPTYISPSVERLRGFTPEEAVEQNLREALTPASWNA